MPRQHSSSSMSTLGTYLSDIKVAHSIFALPFAASAFLISDLPSPTGWQIFLLLIAIVSARSFAMGANRFVDASIDALNPRTKDRALPTGKLDKKAAAILIASFACIFVAASFQLSAIAGWLSFPVLVILAFYGRMKHISALAHLYLGLCLGLSPIAVGVAISGRIPLELLILSLGVMAWTAGFDILYALQDMSFDRRMNLKSIPALLGVKKSLFASQLLFLAMLVLLLSIGTYKHFGLLYFIGVLLIGILLLIEHLLVRESREEHLSKHINVAFFNANALVSVLFFTIVCLDKLFFIKFG